MDSETAASADHTPTAPSDHGRTGIEAGLRRRIAASGFALIHSQLAAAGDPGDGVAFTYTVGLTERNLAELCITGLDHSLAGALLYTLAGRTIDPAHGPLRHGQPIRGLADRDMICVEGPPSPVISPIVALSLYGPRRVRLQQCVWPDQTGAFPWDVHHLAPAIQPIITAP